MIGTGCRFVILVCISTLFIVQSLRPVIFNSPTREARCRRLKMKPMENNDKDHFIVEIVASRELTSERSSSGFNKVYKEAKVDKVDNLIFSPVATVVQFIFNPTTLLFAVYFSTIAWGKVSWVQKILKIFGRGNLVTKPGEAKKVAEVDLPFEVYECESCKMELRPAKGRADIIFGRPRFRCARCGAKASAFFNIDDPNDPRAVARLERIKKEKEEADAEDYDDDKNDEDEDAEPPKKK